MKPPRRREPLAIVILRVLVFVVIFAAVLFAAGGYFATCYGDAR